MGYCYGWGAYGSNFAGGYWWIMPLIFLGLLITGIVLIVRTGKNRGRDRALAILQEEYALGRISRDEFITRRKDLK